MKNYLKNLVTVGFLALFLPYTITLLVNGRQGIHRESEWTELELSGSGPDAAGRPLLDG